MTTGTDVLDVQGSIDRFAEDGVFTGIGGVSGPESYQGEHLEDVVAIELSIRLRRTITPTSPEGNP